MMKTIYGILLTLLGIAVAFTVQAKGDAKRGQQAYAVCQACHGANGEGNKALNAPRLAGQQDWYVARQVQNFKAGIRGSNPKDVFGMQMRPMAMTLATDQVVEDVAAYIATLKGKVSAAPTVKGDAKAGKVAYAICQACHGAQGEGSKALNAPKLAGQQDWYLVRQLQNFKAGIRGTHAKDMFGMQMRPMAMTLANDAAVNNVAAYIASLKE
jgi:cytochrome c oxidase subunit 2